MADCQFCRNLDINQCCRRRQDVESSCTKPFTSSSFNNGLDVPFEHRGKFHEWWRKRVFRVFLVFGADGEVLSCRSGCDLASPENEVERGEKILKSIRSETGKSWISHKTGEICARFSFQSTLQAKHAIEGGVSQGSWCRSPMSTRYYKHEWLITRMFAEKRTNTSDKSHRRKQGRLAQEACE